jgi:hypothetical protein
MTTIWKYEFEISDETQFKDMPRFAQILHVQAQDGFLVVWAKVFTSQELERRFFRVYGTGHPIHPDHAYVGTAIITPFVWHLFEVVEP